MKPFLSEVLGTEMHFLFGGVATLLLSTGSASLAVVTGFAGLLGGAYLLASVLSRHRSGITG